MATNCALLVAINNYGSQQNNLPSCLEDASRFRSLLEERYGFDQFTELYDGDATVANVEQGLTWLFEDVAPDDRLVFFYSGHGYQQPNGENLEECLVLSNMEFLFDDRLSELSQTAPPGVLTVVFDSCFSGGMEKQVEADGRIEIARTKAWVPPANARSQQQKSLIGQQLIPRPFGSQEVTDPAGVKALVLGRAGAPSKAGAGDAAQGDGHGAGEGADETGELALNGLLLSACSENETASAATSATDGMSAFTCALMGVLDAAQGEFSVAELHEQTRAKLQELGFRQTPLLKAPNEPADLASMGFVTLAPGGGEAEQGQRAQGQRAQGQRAQGKSAVAPAPATRPATRPAPAATRPAPTTRPAPATRPAPTTRPAPGAARAGAAAAPPATSSGAGASPNKPGIAPGEPRPTPPRQQGPTPPRQQGATPPREQRATPSSGNGSTPTNATEGEESAMNTSAMTTMQPNEEKWIGLAAGVAASVLPQVISAIRSRRKDFEPEVMAAAAGGAGNGDDTDAEQKWVAALARAVIPAAISAAPELINAVRGRGKDAAVGLPATGGMGAEDAEGEEKWIGLAAGVAASVLPQVISAIRNRRKDFAPEVMPAAPAGAGNGNADDAEQKWVAALARAVMCDGPRFARGFATSFGEK